MKSVEAIPELPDYIAYAHMDQLLSLQHPKTSLPVEMAFIVLSQVDELLFCLLASEVEHAAEALRTDRLVEACRTLERIVATVHTLHSVWEPMAVMSHVDYSQIRGVLGNASGLQSVSYRKWVFAMGLRNPKVLDVFRGRPDIIDYLEVSLQTPSLYDEAIAFLARNGHSIPIEVLGRDVRAPYEPNEAVKKAWADVYDNESQRDDLERLAESLISVAYAVGQWRYSHLLTVERMIGPGPGTGGTSGASWLARVAEHRFFPELWQVRQDK